MRLASSILSILLVTTFSAIGQDQLSRSKTENLYKKGTELVSHSNFSAARVVFSDFLKYAAPTDARRADAAYFIALSALKLGHSDGEKLIADFISHNPSNPRSATAYFDLANFFYAEKEYTKAIGYYSKVNFAGLSQDQQVEGYFKWGYSYFNQKKLDEALEKFNAVKLQESQFAPAANYYAGFIEYSKGNYADALADLKRAEANASYSNIVPSLIASVYYKQRKYDELINYAASLESRSAQISNYSEISMLVADAYYYKRDYTKAAAAYEIYLEDNQAKAENAMLFRAGFANYSLGQDAKAITYLKTSASRQDSVSFYASYYLGILYLKQGNKQFALNSFNHSKGYTADRKLAEESTFQYAKISYDLGKSDVAITEFEKFLVAYPASDHSVAVRELLAQAYVNGNNYNKAIEYIEALPRRTPSVDQAYQKATYLKGSELFNKDDYANAVSFFEKSLASPVDPKYVALASFWNGETYSIGSRFEEAIPFYQKVLMIPSAEAEVVTKTRYGLGYAFFNLKQYDQALLSFKEFVNKSNKAGANYADGVLRLADCYFVTKAYPEALANYEKAQQLKTPDVDYVLFQRGVINGILRKYADARTQFSTLISGYPKSQYRDEALFQRAQFEIEQSNYAVAISDLTRLINEGSQSGSRFLPYAYERRAASNYNLKAYDKTIADYETVIKQYSSHPVARQVLLPLQEALSVAKRSDEYDQYLAMVTNANPGGKDLEVINFESAKNQYYNQQYAKAITSFSTFLTTYPSSAKLAEAKFYVAESHYRLLEYDKAMVIYAELENDPTSPNANKIAGRIAEIQFKQGKYTNAVVSYHKVERFASSKKDLYTAWSGLMESFYLLAQYDSVTTYANLILEKGNVNAGAQNKASLYLGKAAMAKGDYETAKDEFLNTLNTARDEYGAEAKYRIGEIFALSKQYKQSNETLIGISSSPEFSVYDEWVGKSFLLLADNYLAQGDAFNAKATLESLITNNFPLQYIRDAAADKLKKIAADELKEQQKVKSDTTGK
ncbi:MAG: tetratricopeptide repeat protein [Cyclobacteriaceae bacterium]|nr:tetratricopeptide repeat protein [Cyclobacteriaceae bacterium]